MAIIGLRFGRAGHHAVSYHRIYHFFGRYEPWYWVCGICLHMYWGLRIPFFVLSFFITRLGWIRKYSGRIMKVGGYVMIAVGILLFFDGMTYIIKLLSPLFSSHSASKFGLEGIYKQLIEPFIETRKKFFFTEVPPVYLIIGSTALAIFMGTLALIVRSKAAKKPVTSVKIILPPLFMSTGALMFIFEEFRVSPIQVVEALVVGMLFSIILIKTTNFETQRWRYLHEKIENISFHPAWIAYRPACRKTTS